MVTTETVRPAGRVATGEAIRDRGPSRQLRGLEVLELRDNAVTDFAPLALLPALCEVDIRGNPDAYVPPLADGVRVPGR